MSTSHEKDVRTPRLKPRIDVSMVDLPILTRQAWEALQASNDPIWAYRSGGLPSRIERSDNGEPVIKTLDYKRMRHHLARVANWMTVKETRDETIETPCPPPKDVVEDLLATPNMKLPPLSRIVEAPVFANDGTIQTEPGYHEANQTLYLPAKGFNVPYVAARPTERQIDTARALLCFELFADFPFIGNAELAHVVALTLLPFARDLIDGPTPLHLIEKPSPGTGATLMVDVAMYPAIGRPVAAMTEGRNEDEWRKRLTAKFRGGAQITFIDNLRGMLDSAAVSSAITSPTWEDRILAQARWLSCQFGARGLRPETTPVFRARLRVEPFAPAWTQSRIARGFVMGFDTRTCAAGLRHTAANWHGHASR